jgi:hypothetical protein
MNNQPKALILMSHETVPLMVRNGSLPAVPWLIELTWSRGGAHGSEESAILGQNKKFWLCGERRKEMSHLQLLFLPRLHLQHKEQGISGVRTKNIYGIEDNPENI